MKGSVQKQVGSSQEEQWEELVQMGRELAPEEEQ